MDNMPSLADISAVTNGGGFGGGSIWLIAIIILIMMAGGRGYGYGAGDFGNFATAASQSEILIGQQFQNLDNKLDRLGNGIADATYALNNSILNEGRNTQAAVANNRYEMANFAAQINANISERFSNLEKNQLMATINDQARQIDRLNLQSAMCGLPRISNVAWGVAPVYQPTQSCCPCNGTNFA